MTQVGMFVVVLISCNGFPSLISILLSLLHASALSIGTIITVCFPDENDLKVTFLKYDPQANSQDVMVCVNWRFDGRQPLLLLWSKGSNPGCQCFHVQCCRSGKCSVKDRPPWWLHWCLGVCGNGSSPSSFWTLSSSLWVLGMVCLRF